MRLEIAERLRCPRAHEPTPLVLVAERVVERELVTGIAGCPVCALEARVHGGSVLFPSAQGEPGKPITDEGPRGLAWTQGDPEARTDREAIDRLIALLMLSEPGGAVLLAGRYARFAHELAGAVDVSVVVIWPQGARAAEHPPTDAPRAVCEVGLAEPVVPFSDGTFRAAALDASVDGVRAQDAVRTVAAGGRVVGAGDLLVPLGVQELARDADEWVGAREPGFPGVIPLRRA